MPEQIGFIGLGNLGSPIAANLLAASQTAAAGRAPMPVLGLLRDRFLAALANGREHRDGAALASAPRTTPGSSGSRGARRRVGGRE